jgi:hypothetical protein
MNTITEIPFLFIIYWALGYENSIDQFAVFALVLCACMNFMGSVAWVMAMGLGAPDVATQASQMVLLLGMLFGGMMVPYNEMPDFISWGHWLSFFTYALDAVLLNEYGSTDAGILSIHSFGGIDSRWTAVLILLAFFVFVRVVGTLILYKVGKVADYKAGNGVAAVDKSAAEPPTLAQTINKEEDNGNHASVVIHPDIQ